MRSIHALVLHGLALATLPGVARAQGVLYSWSVPAGQAQGAAVGDVDGDGRSDLALGEMGATGDQSGRLRVFSGATGKEILRVLGPAAGSLFGSRVAGLGDVDGDGRADIVVSAPGIFHPTFLPFVRLVSGATGATLWETEAAASDVGFGVSLERLDDLDHDGVSELAVGASRIGLPGAVLVLSGTNGAVLHSIAAPPGASTYFGHALDSGDFDGNGARDLVIGDPGAASSHGRVSVHRATDGDLLASFDGTVAYGDFGSDVAILGDIDHDGVSDLVVGSPFETVTPQVSWGRVRLLSGATGAVLQLLEGGGNLTRFGEAVEAYPDLDGDGVEEIALSAGMYKVGCCTFYSAELRIYSSASAVPLYFGDGHAAREFVVVPDISHDGYADYLLPSTYVPSGEWSAALIAPWQLPPIPLEGCPPKRTSQGCKPEIAFRGAPSPTVGDALVVEAFGLLPATFGFFLWSTQAASIPFGGGTLCLANRVHRSPLLHSTASEPPCASSSQPTGSMSWRFPDGALLALGIPPGSAFYVQAWFRDQGFSVPHDIGLTGAIVFTLWP